MITPGDTIDLRDGRRMLVVSVSSLKDGRPHVILQPRGGTLADAFAMPLEQARESIALKVWTHYPAGTDVPPLPVPFGPPEWCRTPMACQVRRGFKGEIQGCPCL